MKHVYCFTEASAAPAMARRPGLDGQPVHALVHGDMAALFSEASGDAAAVSQVLDHERVVEAAMAQGPVLPVRCGTVLRSREEIASVLAARHGELRARLDDLRGVVEMGVCVVVDEQPQRPGRAASGREYLLSRVGEHRRREEILAAVHRPLAALARGAQTRQSRRMDAALTASYLVEREHESAFRARADALSVPEARIIVTGPWPPYSFVAGERPCT